MRGRAPDFFVLATLVGVGAAAGALYSGGAAALLIGSLVGAVLGAATVAMQVRSVVAVPIGIGAAVGLLAGKSIAHVLCLPSTCVGLETFAAVATAVGAAVGVGLVVALTATSLDEFRAARQTGTPPPQPGCETGDEDQGT